MDSIGKFRFLISASPVLAGLMLFLLVSNLAHAQDPRPRQPLVNLVPENRDTFGDRVENRDFSSLAMTAENRLESAILDTFSGNDRLIVSGSISRFLDEQLDAFVSPQAVDESYLKGFACTRRPDVPYRELPTEFAVDAAVALQIEAGILPRSTRLNCNRIDSGEDWTRSSSTSEVRIAETALLEYLYGLNAQPDIVNSRSWFRYRLTDFVAFQVLRRGIQIQDDGSITFSFDVTKAYFSAQLPFQVVEKNRVVRDGLLYDESDYLYGRRTNFDDDIVGLPDNTIPLVHALVTCRGSCVAYDTSSFAQFVGTFTYPWQILFHTDVQPTFSDQYSLLLSKAGAQNIWSIWADLIAGTNAGLTLRGSDYFREIFSGLTIENATP